jgi:endonuclease/exonuclease/phosphatase family metal-dependent hydrolase
MKQTLRCLLVVVLVLVLLVGLDYGGIVDVPGIDPTELGLSSPTTAVEPPAPEDGPSASAPDAPTADPDAPRIRLVTWNLYNFGRTKDDQEISVAAQTLRDADLVAAQEIVTSPPGAQAIGKLDRELDRTGAAWDYRISPPTTGPGTEKYAFLWKPSRLRLMGRAWLEASLADSLDREPYLARFEHRESGHTLLVASLHAVPTSKNPEREIALLDRLHWQYETDHVVLVGDFNLDEDDAAFNELRGLGYASVLDDQPTSLRRERREGPNGHLANEYDNIFYESTPLRTTGGGVLDFTPRFSSLKEARSLSDHLPVYADVQWALPAPVVP